MLLFINTNSKEEINFAITDDAGIVLNSKKHIIDFKDSQKILNLLEEFINNSKLNINNINYLVVCNGPGINMNFRIGIIISNTIAYALKIKMVSILSSEFSSLEEFIKIGIEKINKKEYSDLISPEYSIKNT